MLVTVVLAYCIPYCLADDFVLNGVCSWSEAVCHWIVGDFNTLLINRIKLTALRQCFDGVLLQTIIQCALVRSFAKPILMDLGSQLPLLNLAIAHHCNDVIKTQDQFSLATSAQFVLHFRFLTYKLRYDLLHLVQMSDGLTF